MGRKVLIIGGGMTGLTAAYHLSRNPAFSITLLESSDHLGGLAAGFPLLGTSLEKTYHHLFRTDTSILSLVEELGLQDKLMWCNSSMGIYRNGRVYPFMSPVDLLRFAPCNPWGRVRVGATAFYLKHKKNWRGLVHQSAHRWMRGACGQSAMETIWAPLLKGKFGRYYDSISMAWLWARIHIRANSRSPGQGEKLGYFRGGFNVVVQALEQELRRRDVTIRLRESVAGFRSAERSVIVNDRALPFDDCVFTGSSAAFANLLPAEKSLEAYAQKLRSIEYLGAICLVFTSDQDIGRYYWTNVNEPDAPFLVFLNHTRFIDKKHYQNRCVYYIGTYLPIHDRAFSLPDQELARSWWAYLKKIHPEFDPARIDQQHVFRFKAAQHIVDTDYDKKIPDYQTPLPGVLLANFSQVFPEDRGTNYAVREGFRISQRLLQDGGFRAGK